MAVKDRASESGAFNRVTVAATGDMPAGKHELELPRTRFAEKGDRRAVKTAVFFDLFIDEFRVFRAMQTEKYFFDHGLLVLGEEVTQLGLYDLPVVVDLRAERVVKREAKLFTLLSREGFVKGLDKGFGILFLLGIPFAGEKFRGEREGSGSGEGETGCGRGDELASRKLVRR
jgi:hypothetical protein